MRLVEGPSPQAPKTWTAGGTRSLGPRLKGYLGSKGFETGSTRVLIVTVHGTTRPIIVFHGSNKGFVGYRASRDMLFRSRCNSQFTKRVLAARTPS